MFSIYGEDGRLFRGPMEDLLGVQGVQALRPILRSRRVQGPRSTPFSAPSPQSERPPSAAPSASSTRSAPTSFSPTPMTPAVLAHTAPTLSGSAVAAYVQASGQEVARHPLTRVGQVMNRQVLSVAVDLPLRQAWQLLRDAALDQAPVIRADGALVGLLTSGELLNLDRLPRPETSPLAWQAWLMQAVGQVMLSPVPAVSEDTDLRRVARVLLDTHLPGLPVVQDDGQLIGFVSWGHILTAVAHDPPLDLWS